jgi:hypothetical protein
MEFEYEVSADDYVDATILYYKLNRRGLGAGNGKLFILGGLLLTVGLIERARGISPLILVVIAAFTIWIGIVGVFPGLSSRRNYRKHYQEWGIKGRKYRADVNEGGLNITGDEATWSRPWADISSKGENKQLFVFYSRGTLFIFAKRYLTDEQQQALRNLIGLS